MGHTKSTSKRLKNQSMVKVGLIFNTIGISDGISMGTPGMRFSLPSRDIIADSIESVVRGMSYDGIVTIDDKNFLEH